MRNRKLRSIAPVVAMTAALSVVLSGFSAAEAVSPIDQTQTVADGTIAMPPGLAQTLTIGRTGTLDAVTVFAATGGPMFFALYGLHADGTPDATIVYQPPIQVALLPDVPADIILTTPVPVTVGQQIAIAVGTIRTTQALSLYTGSGDPYGRGQLFKMFSATNAVAVTGVDLEFSTHVLTAEIATTLAVKPLRVSDGHPTAILTAGGTAVSGKSVTFELMSRNGLVRSTCSAITDATGKATCSVRWTGRHRRQLRAIFIGDIGLSPSTTTIEA